MRLLFWLIAAGAVALGVWYLASRPGHSRRLRSLVDFSWAFLSLVVLAVAAYAAHSIGLFSIPLVALAFIPIGLAVRWLMVGTRGARTRREPDVRPVPAGLWDRVALPVLVLMVIGVAVIGVVVGTLVGPH